LRFLASQIFIGNPPPNVKIIRIPSALFEPSGYVPGLGCVQPGGVGQDLQSNEIEAVGIPTASNGWIAGKSDMRVIAAGLLEPSQLLPVDGECALSLEMSRVRSCAVVGMEKKR